MEKKATTSKKECGLGRGFQSLLDDNTPDIGKKAPLVVRKDGSAEEIIKKETCEFHKKEEVIHVKKVKRSWS